MKTLILSIALFGLVAVAPAFAGGDPDQLGSIYGNGSINAANAVQGTAMASSTAETAAAEAEAARNQLASASESGTLWQIVLVVAIIALAGGLLTWSYRRNKI